MMENIKKVVEFYNELAKALKDKRVSFNEGIGLLPELVAFLSVFKDMAVLKAEITELQDRFNNGTHSDFKEYLLKHGIELDSDVIWAISESIFWASHALTLMKK